MIANGNPALNENTFDLSYAVDAPASNVMTLGSTVFKSLTLVGLCVVAATVTWGMAMNQGVGAALPWAIGGAILGFILALVTIFKPQASPVSAPLYALAQGLFLGAISAFYETAYGSPNGKAGPLSGIVVQAAGLTLGVLAVMLTLYGTRVIKVTNKLRSGVIAATGAVCLFYLVSFVVNLIAPGTFTLLHDNGPLGIGISLVIVGIAAFNLLLDFDLIEKGVQGSAPKYMEWYAGFALLVTLIWLYLEILRLLSKLRSR